MSRWVHYDKEWYNLDDFCHIWIETRKFIKEEGYCPEITVTGYYAMGEWRHNGEEVIITQDWDSFEELRRFLNERLNVYYGWTRE